MLRKLKNKKNLTESKNERYRLIENGKQKTEKQKTKSKKHMSNEYKKCVYYRESLRNFIQDDPSFLANFSLTIKASYSTSLFVN